MMQQEKSESNLNAGINNGAYTILPAKSKTVRSYTTNNQSLEQIMKKANEIIKRTKNSQVNGRPDITDILHPFTDSFVTLTTNDSLQKNSQSTNREGNKISPFVTTSPLETTLQKQQNLQSSDKSIKDQIKITIGSQEDSEDQSQKINISKQHINNKISEVDYVFDNFDYVYQVTFTKDNKNNGGVHTNNFSQKQNGTSLHQSHSANTRDTDDSCRISLTQVFERVRREEKCQQLNKSQSQQDQNQQGVTPQQQAVSSVHIRASSQTPNTSDNSYYLIPKQVQQTTSSLQLKIQSQQQQEKQQLLQSTGQLQIVNPQSSYQKENLNSSLQFQNLQQIASLQAPSSQQISCTQQLSSQQSQVTQSEIDQYLKKPEPAKVKNQSNAPLHPHPPLPQSTKLNLNQYNTNHFNSQRFRYRNSIRDKENISEAANSSIGYLNTSNGQIMSNINKSTNNGSYLNNLSNGNISQNYQPTQIQQPQQLQLQQSNSSNSHQRSSSNINNYCQNILNNSQNQNNSVQNSNSNSLQNSFGFYRPRFDSTSGPSNTQQRLNTIGNDYNIKNYASSRERGTNNTNDLSLNYSSLRVNTSYNGSTSNIQSTNTNNGNQNSSRSGSLQINIPMNKLIAGKQSAGNSLLNCLLGGQKVQQPQSSHNNTIQNNGNTNKSVNTAINNSTSNQGSRSTSVPRANVAYLLQKY